ncbi:MAG TPA: hypothetical protein VJ571_05520 [Candidatus Nitrosotalea sp.]|nr:hypothetical protein [Candidatus Nitrosotalea sp.]
MQEKFRLQPYETRNITEKIMDGIYQGKTINEISHELPEISSSTIYKKVKELKDVGFIEEV